MRNHSDQPIRRIEAVVSSSSREGRIAKVQQPELVEFLDAGQDIQLDTWWWVEGDYDGKTVLSAIKPESAQVTFTDAAGYRWTMTDRHELTAAVS